jgi:hypothetical protein
MVHHRTLSPTAMMPAGEASRILPVKAPALPLALIHPSAWKRNSAKFGVARSQARLRPSGVGVGLSRDSNPISQALAEFVAWIRGKLSQVVACELPEKCCVRVHQHVIPGGMGVPLRRPWPIGTGLC